jgi:hypothetical protein
MKTIDAFLFTMRMAFNHFDLAPWVWAFVAFAVVFFLLGLGWALLWNRKWSMTGHPLAGMLMSFVFGLGLMACVVAWFGATRASGTLDSIRTVVDKQMTSSGVNNRDTFRRAWERLQPLGGQGTLTPPSEGGMEIQLNSPADALILAEEAAATAKRPLLAGAPFTFGAPGYVKDPAAVAAEVVEAVPTPAYPVTVAPDNQWSRAATSTQVAAAFDSAVQGMRVPMEDLKKAVIWAGIIIVILQLLLTARAAYADIQENPRV